MSTPITCPACKTIFNIEEVLSEDVEKAIKEKYEAKQNEFLQKFTERNEELTRQMQEFEEKKKKENELFQARLQKELELLGKKKEEELIKKLQEENKTKIEFLEKEREEQHQKLKALRDKELEVLELNKKIKTQEEETEHLLRKQKIEIEALIKEQLTQDILLKEREKFDMERRETEKRLADQNKLIEEMQRKMQQGSMQTQGEVQELALEETLMNSFPFDLVKEVGKGKRGADCILIVRNELGQECGKIIFESKRTKDFDKKWLTKLKEDALESACDIPVLVTQVFPDDMKLFDQREGVWICKFNEVSQLVKALREGIINVYRANKSQENKGEKKEMLYNYFTSNEFVQQMRAINEAYLYLKTSIDKERLQMEKIWKEREKQIDKVLLTNSHLIGSIKGIAGNDVEDMNLLDS